MTTKSELMAGGLPAALANRLGQDGPNTGLVATGANQADALALISTMNIFATVAANTGALLPEPDGKALIIIVNNGANPLSVYPQSTQTINGAAASAALSVPAGKAAFFVGNGNQWGANVSA